MLHRSRFNGVECNAGLVRVLLAIHIGDDAKETSGDLVLHLLGGADVAHVPQGQNRRGAKRQAHPLAGAAGIKVQADLFLRHKGALDLDACRQQRFTWMLVPDPIALKPAGAVELLAKQDVDAVVLVEVQPVGLQHLHLERRDPVALEQLRIYPLAHQHRAARGGGPGAHGLVPVPVVNPVEVGLWRVRPALPRQVVPAGCTLRGGHDAIADPVVDDHADGPGGVGVVIGQVLVTLDQPVPRLAQVAVRAAVAGPPSAGAPRFLGRLELAQHAPGAFNIPGLPALSHQVGLVMP